MNAILQRLRLRLLPALLVAVGVALLGNGLLAYTSAVEDPPTILPLPSYEPLPTFDRTITLPTGSSAPTPSAPADRVATRIVIRRLGIDLPIVLQSDYNKSYPLCDVAMYLPLFSQPGQGRATYIYAHAREGMFLPLLTASQKNNGKAMIGMTAEVYTSDDWHFLYTISEVRRHTLDLKDAVNATTEQLWLQTSEGPNGTVPKLQVVAEFLSAEPTDPASAHPTPHPRICH